MHFNTVAVFACLFATCNLVKSSYAVNCTAPPVSVNLAYHPANSQYLPTSQVTYHCSDGRSVIPASSRTITCMVSGSWSISVAPTCQAVCVKPPAITIGSGSYSPVQNTYQPNENITYSCNGTTRLVGSATNICGSNFGWSTVAPQCDIACSAPPPPNANSSVGLSSASLPYSVGTTAKYSCSLGYRLVGIEILTCTSEGWVPAAPPTCQLVCLNPPLPVNGTVSPNVPATSGYDLGTTIRYTCTGTNNIIGSSINICQNDGSWRYAAIPVCSSVCYSAPTIPNGDYMPKQIYANPGTSVSYSCNSQSHQIRGSIQATCQAASLTWSTAPVCLTVCGNPPAIANGMNSLNGGNAFLEGDKVNYTCNAGYRITPALSRMNPLNENTCTSTGNWAYAAANDLPSCEPICTSRPPGITVGGGLTNGSPPYAVGVTVNYTCMDPSPSLPFGNTSNRCVASETWENAAPMCLTACRPPPTLSFGSFLPVMTYYNASATVNYTCNSGFTLIGSNNVTCSNVLTWSQQPICAINCPSPPTITNGAIQNLVSDYKNGDNIQYVCNTNYVLTRPRFGTNYGGNNTCLPTGMWMYRTPDYLPTCLPGCVNPPMIGAGNGSITPVKASYVVGDIVQYTCMPPYRIIGTTSNECVQAGDWLHNAGPECYDGCTDLPVIASNGNHMPIGRIHPTQTNVTYNCSENYSLKGEVNNRCLPQVHTWSQPTAPMCLRNCPTPPQAAGGTTTVVVDPIPGKSVAGMKVNYSCPANYAMQVTIMDNTCNSLGAWGSAAPVCVRSCGPPPAVTVGTNTFSPSKAVYLLNETVTYVCGNGLTLVGESTTLCKNDTTWTGTPPQCFAGCQRPFTANGSLVLIQPDRASYLEGTTITFTCRYNAKLTGSTNATCLRNTTWDAPLPKCGCGPPPQVTVGNATLTPSKPDFMPGEVVTYTCGCDLTLVGKSTTICQNNNTWSNQSPQCLTKCTRPTIATGSKVQIQPDQQEYLEGTNITFTCANNVTLTGAVSSTCLGNTTWDATLPTCGVVIQKMSLVLTLLCAVLVALLSH